MSLLAKALAAAIAVAAARDSGAASAVANPSTRYVFYLHGAIVEEQGPQGVSERFGRYDYPGIVDAFRKQGFTLVSEVRPRGTKVSSYADKVVGQIESLLRKGVSSDAITVVGASKGSIIAMLVSTRLQNGRVRYVLLAGCNASVVRNYDPRLTGEVLAIYEQSDELAGSCEDVRKHSPRIARFSQLKLKTGLGHGMVYRPIVEWLEPAVRWARR